MVLENLTPHAVAIEGYGTVPPSGIVARVRESVVCVESLEGIPILRVGYAGVEGLPDALLPHEWEQGTAVPRMYIVSAMVLQACAREDLVAPYTGPDPRYAPIREGGRVMAVRALVAR